MFFFMVLVQFWHLNVTVLTDVVKQHKNAYVCYKLMFLSVYFLLYLQFGLKNDDPTGVISDWTAPVSVFWTGEFE